MKCKAIMKYSFNQNQTIPKHIKKKVTAFCFSLSLSPKIPFSGRKRG